MKDSLAKTAESLTAGKVGPRNEQRREVRRAAHGPVEVRWSDPVETEIRGTLVDVSAGGFRMAHTYMALESGRVVEFTHQEAQGRARVVWTRVVTQEVTQEVTQAAAQNDRAKVTAQGGKRATGHRVESGFVVLNNGPLAT